ncbi:MAG TPA: hypothetical protein VGB74_03455 [Actinoplanes sp.]
MLASLAAVIALLGHDSTAVLLTAVGVALIGVALLRQRDPARQQAEIEERVAGKVAALRREMRAEFGGGAGAGASPSVETSGTFYSPSADTSGSFYSPSVESSGSFYVRPAEASGYGQPAEASGYGQPAEATGGYSYGQPPEESGFFGGLFEDQPAQASPIPRQRGSASVPAMQPRDYAAGSGSVTYGRPEALEGDFGASTGYVDTAGYLDPGYADTGGSYPAGGNTYGSKGTPYGSPATGYDADDYNGYGDGYGPAGGRNAASGYEPADYRATGYDQPGAGYADPSPPIDADAQYRARRHRPSANDTNVGTPADFAAYGGHPEPAPADHYAPTYGSAPGYGTRRTRR